jgi:hypothetical protein
MTTNVSLAGYSDEDIYRFLINALSYKKQTTEIFFMEPLTEPSKSPISAIDVQRLELNAKELAHELWGRLQRYRENSDDN